MGVIIRLGLALLGGVIAALAWLRSAPAPAEGPYEADAMAAKQRIEGWLREQASALHGRATTLAAIPRLAIAVTTDAATCADFMKNELGFTPLPNETFELVQLERGRTARLVRVPDVELPLDWNRRGPAVLVDGKQLVISEVMPVGERGALAVAWRFPADQIAARAGTVERLVDGALVVGTVTLPLGKGLDETAAHTRVVPMPLDAPDPARYLATLGPVARPVAWPLRTAGLAIGIGLALVACIRRKASPPVTAEPVPLSNAAWLAATGTVAYAGAPPAYDAALASGVLRASGLAIGTGDVPPPDPTPLHDAAIWLADSPVSDAAASSVETRAADVSAWLERRPLAAGAMPDSTELVQVLAQLRTGERSVPVAVAIAVARQICTQVTVLGGREISATNVFVSRAGAISLGNLAAAYRSPASEAFAIGAILYELLSLTPQRTDVPAELDAIVQRAVAADLSERYSCCEELATDLAFVVGAYALEITGAEIAHWLACETLAWSPTLRGWPMLDVTG